MDTAIHKAHEKKTFLSNNKETLRFYNIRQMAQIDYNSGLRKAKKATGLSLEEIDKLTD